MIEPKPCPFCGELPTIFPKDALYGSCWGRVKCINEECPAQPGVDDGVEIADNRGSEKYKEEAIKRWNIRRG